MSREIGDRKFTYVDETIIFGISIEGSSLRGCFMDKNPAFL